MSNRVYCFGPFRLDPAKRELENGGELVTLTPQVFDCLTWLVEHRDRAVGRDELIAAVWGRADVSETLLGQTVMHARRAVGDSGDAQRLIRTIPRFGYRWVDEATVEEPQAVPAQVAPTDVDGSGHRPGDVATARPVAGRWWRRMAAAALLVLAVVAVAWLSMGDTVDGESLAPQAAGLEPLLVLPVAITATADSAWIPLGVMDSIASQIRDAGWAVVPSATVVALTGRPEGPVADRAELGTMTGAGLVVQPHARRTGDGWSVRLDLAGSDSVPAGIDAAAPDLLEAARLASDRLIAVLQREPMPERALPNPDAALAELVQRIEAEFLANRLDAADALLASAPVVWRERPELRFQRAHLHYRTGRLALAEQGFTGLLADVQAPAQAQLRARALIGLGSIARTRVQFDEAARFYRQAIVQLEPLRQPSLTGTAQTYLGISLSSLGRSAEATQALAQARVTLEGTGDAIGVVVVDAGFATMQADRRRLRDAVDRLQVAIERFDRLGAETEAFDKRIALTQMSRELLDNATALSASAAMWERVRGDQSQRLFPMAAAMRATTLVAAGQLQEARTVLGSLDDVAIAGSDRGYQWRQTRLAAAQLHLVAGEPELAERALTGVLPESDDVDSDAGLVWLLQLRAMRAQGHVGAAASILPRVARWANPGGVEYQIQASLIRAEQMWAQGDIESASAIYEVALGLADDLGVPAYVAQVADSYGTALIDAGNPTRAMGVVGRIAAWTDRDFGCALLEARLYHALGQSGAWRRAIERARTLAGERELPAALLAVPAMSPD